jgi:hypothetical protein
MAKPAKRRVEGGPRTGGDDVSSSTGDAAPPASTEPSSAKPPSATSTSKRVTPPKAKRDDGPSRYTAPRPGASKRPSPPWVPVLMFGLWGVGLLVIILNYMELLPGTTGGGNGWYLVGGLVAILAGIMVATQYR